MAGWNNHEAKKCFSAKMTEMSDYPLCISYLVAPFNQTLLPMHHTPKYYREATAVETKFSHLIQDACVLRSSVQIKNKQNSWFADRQKRGMALLRFARYATASNTALCGYTKASSITPVSQQQAPAGVARVLRASPEWFSNKPY